MTNMITKITSIAAAAAIITAAIPTAEYLTGTSITSVTASAAAVNTLTLSDLDRIEREWESHPYVPVYHPIPGSNSICFHRHL